MNIFFLHFTKTALLLCNILFIICWYFVRIQSTMELLLEWPINLMKPLLTRQRKDWQTYSKVWIDVQMPTVSIGVFSVHVFKLFVVYLLGIVCFIQNYMYVNFVLLFNVFYQIVLCNQVRTCRKYHSKTGVGQDIKQEVVSLNLMGRYNLIFSSNFVLSNFIHPLYTYIILTSSVDYLDRILNEFIFKEMHCYHDTQEQILIN